MYSIIEGNDDDIFSIDNNNGRVFIPMSGSPGVDYNRRQVHNLTVQAINTQQNCQRSRIRINIRVIRNRIDFDNLGTPTVDEGTPTGREVVRVTTSGGVGEIRFSITSGNTGNAFSMEASTGRIRVNGVLDFESRSSYTLGIRADSVETTVFGTMSLTIRVRDVNEPHQFSSASCNTQGRSCSFSVSENLSPRDIGGAILVTDPDQSNSPNGMHTYSIESSTNVPFSVSSDGRVRTTAQLDREATASYRFTVAVRDQCSPNCAITIRTTVEVTVTDLNDNPPVFSLAPATVLLPEDAASNTVAAEYMATDADAGVNAEITYSLVSPPNSLPFTLVSSSSGATLRLTGSIDFEMTQSYQITVRAANGNGVFPVDVSTTINIGNVNDNTPVFVAAPYSVSIAEDASTGTILTISATDGDLGTPGEFR